jgi:hypothetical protein
MGGDSRDVQTYDVTNHYIGGPEIPCPVQNELQVRRLPATASPDKPSPH